MIIYYDVRLDDDDDDDDDEIDDPFDDDDDDGRNKLIKIFSQVNCI
jgi:hypothetical protein